AGAEVRLPRQEAIRRGGGEEGAGGAALRRGGAAVGAGVRGARAGRPRESLGASGLAHKEEGAVQGLHLTPLHLGVGEAGSRLSGPCGCPWAVGGKGGGWRWIAGRRYRGRWPSCSSAVAWALSCGGSPHPSVRLHSRAGSRASRRARRGRGRFPGG